MAEYALILGGIAVVVIAGILILGPAIRNLFQSTGQLGPVVPELVVLRPRRAGRQRPPSAVPSPGPRPTAGPRTSFHPMLTSRTHPLPFRLLARSAGLGEAAETVPAERARDATHPNGGWRAIPFPASLRRTMSGSIARGGTSSAHAPSRLGRERPGDAAHGRPDGDLPRGRRAGRGHRAHEARPAPAPGRRRRRRARRRAGAPRRDRRPDDGRASTARRPEARTPSTRSTTRRRRRSSAASPRSRAATRATRPRTPSPSRRPRTCRRSSPGSSGSSSLTVTAKATACFPCSVRPLDIMLILDRTGSMCAGTPGDNPNANPQVCRDLDAAREGVDTFVSLMDPKLDRVGLAVTPPATGPRAGQGDSPDDACAKPTSGNNYYGFDAWAPWWDTQFEPSYRSQDRAFYVVSSLSDDDVDNNPADDYVIKDPSPGTGISTPRRTSSRSSPAPRRRGAPATSSRSTRPCASSRSTAAPDVQDVIVFFTDGGANTTHDNGMHWSGDSPWFNRPCGSGVQAANNAKTISDSHGRLHRDLHDRLRPREPVLGVAAVPAAGLERPPGQRPAGRVVAVVGAHPAGGADRDGVGAGELLLHRRPGRSRACSSPGLPATCSPTRPASWTTTCPTSWSDDDQAATATAERGARRDRRTSSSPSCSRSCS